LSKILDDGLARFDDECAHALAIPCGGMIAREGQERDGV
jgi:hypothetical protein